MDDDEPAASPSESDAVLRGARAELDHYRRWRTGRGYADDLAASIADALEWTEEPEETRNHYQYSLLVLACEDYLDDERPPFDADAEDVYIRAFAAAFGASIDLALEGDRLLREAIVLDDHITGFFSLNGGLARLDARAIREGIAGLRRLGLVDSAELVAAALGADDDIQQDITGRYFDAIGRGIQDAFRRYYPDHRSEFEAPGRA